MLLSFKTVLYAQGPYMNAEQAYKFAIEYIKIYRPDFEVSKIPTYFLSTNDIKAINRLCTIYRNWGNAEKAIEIYYMLLDNFERNYYADSDNILWDNHIMIICNLAITLSFDVQQYEECIQIADKGIALIKGNIDKALAYFRLLRCKANALMRTGNTQEGEELHKRCIMFVYTFGENTPHDFTLEMQKTEFEKDFGYKLDLSILW